MATGAGNILLCSTEGLDSTVLESGPYLTHVLGLLCLTVEVYSRKPASPFYGGGGDLSW